jgi:hypothetical protein
MSLLWCYGQLGDRQLVDSVSGTTLPITDTAAVGLLECFDADYPIEPMFDTPEAALEHALEVDVADVPVPRDLVAYERTERSDGWIEFASARALTATSPGVWSGMRRDAEAWCRWEAAYLKPADQHLARRSCRRLGPCGDRRRRAVRAFAR